MRILVLDDNQSVAQFMAFLLEDQGHQATVAHDGKSGLFMLRHGTYDGVVLDLMLPDMNGWEVLEEMKKNGPDLPVIVVTGYAEVMPPRVGFEVPVVVKPIEKTKLVEEIERTFRK